MIELYRPVSCPDCVGIETKLSELVVAHRVILVEPGQQPDTLPANTPLPAIKDNGQIITGPTVITDYLRELERFVTNWRRFQSDACYIDDDGETC